MSECKVGIRLTCSKTAVNLVIAKFCQCTDRKQLGRPRKTTQEDVNLIKCIIVLIQLDGCACNWPLKKSTAHGQLFQP